ncbi:MAG: ABC transporter ATP-binding protein [Anaerolineales bacterium]|nr:ABC transporter ATP-binding protein [Anaerolineales bacterium]
MAILETRHLVKQFGGLKAIDAVGFTVEENQILGLIGPNGAGKTTFVNCISGRYRPTSGQVLFLGKDTTGERASSMCRMGMARTFQICQPFPGLKAIENVLAGATFGAAKSHHGDPVELARGMLEFVEFSMPEDTRAAELNAPQLKRLDLARALACKPKLLLLDELAAGLTTGELGDFMNIIRRIRDQGITILMIEHIMEVIMGLCDQIVVIHYGRKIAEGQPEKIAHNVQVLEAYLGADDDLEID